MKAHSTAIISKNAEIANDIVVGPHAIIEDGVIIGPGCEIAANAYIYKGTTIGKNCKVFLGAALGGEPQDLAFKGEETFLKIGDGNVFREYVTAHRGTKEGTSTIIGNNNYFMALSHVAHNCQIGDNVIICNNTLLGGYAIIEDRAFLSGGCLAHQFTRIGKIAILGSGVKITRDVPPYMMAVNNNTVDSYNIIGIKRAGLSAQAQREIREAYRILYRSGLNVSQAIAKLEKINPCDEVKYLIGFVRSSKRGICMARSNRNLDTENIDTGV